MKEQFNTFYWGKNTEVRFEPFTEIPNDVPVTSCMVMAVVNNDHLVLSSPQRGWGLPGGHLEKGETPDETTIRELKEEAAVEIDPNSLLVVGGWLAKKIHKTPKNSIYPDLAYQLLFMANTTKINQFPKEFEAFDRIFVPIQDVLRYATGVNFKPIFEYVIETYKERFIEQKSAKTALITIPSDNAEKLSKEI